MALFGRKFLNEDTVGFRVIKSRMISQSLWESIVYRCQTAGDIDLNLKRGCQKACIGVRIALRWEL